MKATATAETLPFGVKIGDTIMPVKSCKKNGEKPNSYDITVLYTPRKPLSYGKVKYKVEWAK